MKFFFFFFFFCFNDKNTLHSFQIAIPDVAESAAGADILIFVMPHQFVRKICEQLKGKVNDGAIAVSLIKV